MAAFPAAVSAGTRVVFTVDVESKGALGLPAQLDTVCADRTPCGLMEIAHIFEAEGIAATFFLNVYEHPRWGEAVMKDMAGRLKAAGQDLGLHTHPETLFDAKRTEMYSYTLAEQTAIVQEGVRLLRSWSGVPVTSHRAGDYSANADTLEALRRAGVRVDSSLFWGHPHSGLDALGLPHNFPSRLDGLIEIPVTVYQREERPRPFGQLLPPATALRKVDVDWLVNDDEMRTAIDAATGAQLPVLVVFLHSFSLMKESAGGAPVADHHSLDMLRAILDYVRTKQLTVVSMEELAAAGVGSLDATHDAVLRVQVRSSWPRYGWHQAKRLGGISIAAGILALLSIAVAFRVIQRRSGMAGERRRLADDSAPAAADTGSM